MAITDTGTRLTISGTTSPAIPAYSARGLQEVFSPVQSGTLRRTVNGAGVWVDAPVLRNKLALTVSTRDQNAPAVLGALGSTVTVETDSSLRQWVPSGTTSVAFLKTPISGSVRAESPTGASITVSGVSGSTVTLASNASGAFVVARISMSMIVKSWNVDVDTWGAEHGWSLELEEV